MTIPPQTIVLLLSLHLMDLLRSSHFLSPLHHHLLRLPHCYWFSVGQVQKHLMMLTPIHYSLHHRLTYHLLIHYITIHLRLCSTTVLLLTCFSITLTLITLVLCISMVLTARSISFFITISLFSYLRLMIVSHLLAFHIIFHRLSLSMLLIFVFVADIMKIHIYGF